jgi:DNA-binding transcriptional LysR family regulator
MIGSDWGALTKRIVHCSRLLFAESVGDSRADDGRRVGVFRIVTCDTIAIVARLASARGGAALIPEAMVAASGSEFDLRMLKGDPPILPLNICAMWWDDASGIECA